MSRHPRPYATAVAKVRGRPQLRSWPRGGLLALVSVALMAWIAVSGDPASGQESVLEQAASLRAAGRFDEALEVLRVESREIKRVEGEESPRLLSVNDLAAEILIDQGATDPAKLQTAGTLLGKTIAAREALLARGQREQALALGGSLLTLSRLEAAAKRLPAAADAARRALALLGGMSPPDGESLTRATKAVEATTGVIDSLLGASADATRAARDEAATAFASLGMFTEAIEQRQTALVGVLAAANASPDQILSAAEPFARLMLVAGRSDEAIELVEQALAGVGPEQPEQARAVRRLLGSLQLAADRLVLAEESFREVLESELAATKPPAVTVAGDRFHGLLVAALGERDVALPDWFAAAVKTLEKPAADEAAQAIDGLIAAGRTQAACGDPAAAAATLARAQAVASSPRSPDPARAAEAAAYCVAAQLAAADAAAARKTAEPALVAAEASLGPGAAWTGLLRMLVADALGREGQTEKAVTLAQAALTRGLARPDTDWEELGTAIVDRLAATKGNEDLREAYLAMRARQFGDRDPRVAAACSLFGTARLAAGDWLAAADFFARASEMQRASLGDDHPEVAASLALQAHAERAAGLGERSIETATKALAMWERAAGDDHPGTLSAAEVLVAARMQAGDTTGVVELLERLTAVDAGTDSSRRTAHLVRLADMIAPRDKSRAKTLLTEATQSAAWTAAGGADPAVRRRLAFTAALAAHAFTAVGDVAAAKDALQRARGLALQAAAPKPLLDRIEELATRGDQPGRQP